MFYRYSNYSQEQIFKAHNYQENCSNILNSIRDLSLRKTAERNTLWRWTWGFFSKW